VGKNWEEIEQPERKIDGESQEKLVFCTPLSTPVRLLQSICCGADGPATEQAWTAVP